MNAVLSSYPDAAKLIDAIEQKAHDVNRVIATSPAVVAYQLVRLADTLVTITVCRITGRLEDVSKENDNAP